MSSSQKTIKKTKLQALPKLLNNKIYKTGQTRGADDDVIYQNRVSRSSTVLIPYTQWADHSSSLNRLVFENGFIVLINPDVYFRTENIDYLLELEGLSLGRNALVFYETRNHWNLYNPRQRGWTPALSRQAPLGGQYVARIPGTTSTIEGGQKIIDGFDTTSLKGAGIRLYEYANSEVIYHCRLQLEALYWSCFDSETVSVDNGMKLENIKIRREGTLQKCNELGLFNHELLIQSRIINQEIFTICPLCLEKISSRGFFNRLEQAEGREVPDLTVTQINLFHIEELRYGVYNHRQYNLGWGHHHCNVVVKDSGIDETINWMYRVVEININHGYFTPENRPS